MNNTSQIKKGFVSIIMPAFNSEEYIGLAIESVVNQTFKDWELIIVDDFSTDNTSNIVKEKMINNSNIIYRKLDANLGAAEARNRAIELAQGEFLAFLDSDDVWKRDKLEIQINFMIKNGFSFCCTSYDKVNAKGVTLNNKIKTFEIRDYKGILKHCPGNSTIIYNAKDIGKVYISNIRKRNDYLMWLKVVKKSKHLHGLDMVLSSHRIREGSLSKNKMDLIKYHWKVYRQENITVFYSLYLISYWILKKILKSKQRG